MVIRRSNFSALAAALVLLAPASYGARVVERIVARVNNDIITQRQFEQERRKLREQLSEQYNGPDLEQRYDDASKDLLRDLIDKRLMVQKANDLDIKVESEVVKRLDEIRKEGKFATLEDLQAEVEKQGMVWEDFEQSIKEGILMQELIGHEVGARVAVTKEDCRKYFEAHKNEFVYPEGIHLAMILISTENRKPEEAEQRGKEALAEIKGGAKWADVVKKYTDQERAAEGGDIGFVQSSKLAPEQAKALEKLDEGQTTDLIQIKSGYIVLKVLERRAAGQAKFDDVEQRISNMLYDQQMQPALREYLRTLRKESYIYLAPGYIDTGAERTPPANPTTAARITP